MFSKKKKKKTYTSQKEDYIKYALIILIFSLTSYFFMKHLIGPTNALPFLLSFPLVVAIFFFYLFLPIRILAFPLNLILVHIFLRNYSKNKPSDVVVILGKNDYKSPSFWISPNYGTELLILIEYLEYSKKNFSIYQNIDIKKLDQIMENNKIKTLYFFGHGSRHSFKLNAKERVHYCRYSDNKFNKDFVYQIHCNHGGGKSLAEYVVSEENKPQCLPEYGYMSNQTIANMFQDKIKSIKSKNKIQQILDTLKYRFILNLPLLLSFFLWGAILMYII